MSHTPGPWRVGMRYGNNRTQINNHEGSRALCTVWTHDRKRIDKPANEDADWGEWPEGIANARLIAAAPDLLAACQRVLRAIDWAYPNDYLSQAEMSTLLTDAIAKATGGAQ